MTSSSSSSSSILHESLSPSGQVLESVFPEAIHPNGTVNGEYIRFALSVYGLACAYECPCPIAVIFSDSRNSANASHRKFLDLWEYLLERRVSSKAELYRLYASERTTGGGGGDNTLSSIIGEPIDKRYKHYLVDLFLNSKFHDKRANFEKHQLRQMALWLFRNSVVLPSSTRNALVNPALLHPASCLLELLRIYCSSGGERPNSVFLWYMEKASRIGENLDDDATTHDYLSNYLVQFLPSDGITPRIVLQRAVAHYLSSIDAFSRQRFSQHNQRFRESLGKGSSCPLNLLHDYMTIYKNVILQNYLHKVVGGDNDDGIEASSLYEARSDYGEYLASVRTTFRTVWSMSANFGGGDDDDADGDEFNAFFKRSHTIPTDIMNFRGNCLGQSIIVAGTIDDVLSEEDSSSRIRALVNKINNEKLILLSKRGPRPGSGSNNDDGMQLYKLLLQAGYFTFSACLDDIANVIHLVRTHLPSRVCEAWTISPAQPSSATFAELLRNKFYGTQSGASWTGRLQNLLNQPDEEQLLLQHPATIDARSACFYLLLSDDNVLRKVRETGNSSASVVKVVCDAITAKLSSMNWPASNMYVQLCLNAALTDIRDFGTAIEDSRSTAKTYEDARRQHYLVAHAATASTTTTTSAGILLEALTGTANDGDFAFVQSWNFKTSFVKHLFLPYFHLVVMYMAEQNVHKYVDELFIACQFFVNNLLE